MMNIVESLEYAAKHLFPVRSLGLRTSLSSISLHSASFSQAAELFAAGYRPEPFTTDSHRDGWRTYYSLSGTVDGVGVTVFTIDRPALACELPPPPPPRFPPPSPAEISRAMCP